MLVGVHTHKHTQTYPHNKAHTPNEFILTKIPGFFFLMGADFLLVCWHRVLGTFSDRFRWPSGTWAYFWHICSGRFCWPPGHIFSRFCWPSGTWALVRADFADHRAPGHIFGLILLAIGPRAHFRAILLPIGHLGTFSG